MTDEEYRSRARKQYARDGEIEIDMGATVSRAHDHPPEQSAGCRNADEDGAYVQAWVWVAAPCP